ncbi:MAG: 2-oxoglutarate dehydrogenase complex dihydrolipoyllysine-residue succinyltransferase [Gammaproteobacteria bacterium]|nr:2-oxoglutarate dehydrogenase complex dihydrolipoyllysine-residue succinyltransferase [Gammaproteobacteria bacterium]
MSTEVKVPALPESVSDGVLVCWHKQPGEAIRRDEALVDIETDKVVLEVPAPQDGVLEEILVADGSTVVADQVIGVINSDGKVTKVTVADSSGPAKVQAVTAANDAPPPGPAARKLMAENDLDPRHLHGSGQGGRITKADVLAGIEQARATPATQPVKPVADNKPATRMPELPAYDEDRPQKRVPMSRLRARVAERLLQASQTTAMLTTFNEVNMQPIKTLREKHRDAFEKTHGVRLGFMSFFVRAAAEALKQHPDINASIDGEDVVYHGFCDIGVAIGTERGLVVPILRNAEYMSLAEVETDILDYSNRARDGKLTMEEITGGTFSITNGGVFGSMLSTPILNPPQSAILGMHSIKDRPVVENGEVVIRPIMYLALTYDHRIVDGKSAVTFLKTIVELLEDPAAMLLDL